MARHISDIPGMPVGIRDVAQDSDGYIWLAGSEGLSRYDGFEVRAWSGAPGRLSFITVDSASRVVAGDPRTGLFRVHGSELRAIEAPAETRGPGPEHALFDVDDSLWIAWDGRIFRLDPTGWTEIGGGDVAWGGAQRLGRRRNGGILVGSFQGDVWAVARDGRVRRLVDGLGRWIMQLQEDPQGVVATVRFGDRPGLVRITERSVEQLLTVGGRAEGMARRGSTYWIAYPRGVWAVHDDGRREILTEKDGFTGFGSIALDREGGLWMATVKGLSHFPQPDTLVWTELTGLPHVFIRSVHPVEDGAIITSWRGPMHLDPEGRAREVDLKGLFSRSIGCGDPWGGVWLRGFEAPDDPDMLDNAMPSEYTLIQIRQGETRLQWQESWFHGDLVCDAGPDGTYWILAGDRLLRLDGPDAEPRLAGRLPADRTRNWTLAALVARDDRSTLIAGSYRGQLCEAPYPAGDRVLAPTDWSCEHVEEARTLMDLMETPSGHLWLAAAGGGVFVRRDGSDRGWEEVPGELSRMNEVIALRPSPRGGVWAVGWRRRWRVEERGDGGPPEVVERLGAAQGIPAWQNGQGLHEEPDGTIWLPLYSGLVKVPPSAREQDSAPPTVTITSLVADGRQVPPGEPFQLRHGDHALEIRWSTLSFRDPTRIRYRLRLESDPEWAVLSQPFVRLAGLHSGRHRVELGASLDGRTWSPAPAVIEFMVRSAWYEQAWALALMAAVVGTVLYLVHRLRLAHLLRLERQRTRIAMDLHDEMGAGLGSAGLLVGLMGEGELDEEERRRIGEQASQQIRDLGSAMSDIVWSLRPGAETLDALLLFLRQRAGDLFPPAAGPRVTFDAPDPCPAIPLALAQRRNLQWIAVEALHNAARHARARRVVVTLRAESGSAWRLSVRDDGQGFSPAEDGADSSGVGQESMRRRAREIGADLEVGSQPGEGTEVTVRFRPGRAAR